MRYSLVILMILALPVFASPPADKAVYTMIGGDDILVDSHADLLSTKVIIGEDGTIFVLARYFNAANIKDYVKVFRSTDGGATISMWSQLGDAVSGGARDADLDITGGTTPRLFLTYRTIIGGYRTVVAYADPAAALASWTYVDAYPGFSRNAKLATDFGSFDDYYLYLVTSVPNGDGADIVFTRSTDKGLTWVPAYTIMESTSGPGFNFDLPKISYGFGEIVHVAATYLDADGASIEGTIHHVRAINSANSPADWGTPALLDSDSDGSDRSLVGIAASLSSGSVAVMYSTFAGTDPTLKVSLDGGLDWSTPEFPLPFLFTNAIAYEPIHHEFHIMGSGYSSVTFGNEALHSRAGADTPLVWGPLQQFTEQGENIRFSSLAFDPTRSGRVACGALEVTAPRDIFFDAEWRSDPGYPNFEPGFPLALAATPDSPPALVDLDGDGYLEIIFGDAADNVQVLDHTGTPKPGWPVAVPGLSAGDGAIAIGDLGSGELTIVAGADNGQVFALNAAGLVRPGWPYSMGGADPTFVSIGALGGPYRRTIVACSGPNIHFINYRGVSPLGTPGWSTIDRNILYPAAIGDIDGDGVSEVVIVAEDFVGGFEIYGTELDFSASLPVFASGAPSLGDLDGDGAVEILIPTISGQLYGFDGTGASLGAGWPFTPGDGLGMNSPAIARISGAAEPQIVTSSQDWVVHQIDRFGAEQSGFPVNTESFIGTRGNPIIGAVDGGTPDIVTMTRGGKLWSWNNTGAVTGGWPRDMAAIDMPDLTPAMGDIDLDGRNEIVFLGEDELIVVDVQTAPATPEFTWPMSGHDPQRTGCSDCPEDLVTPVQPDETGLPTRVAFAGASPNPVAGTSTQFRFEVPVRASVRLEVFDLRGHRVRMLMRSEIPAGMHIAPWDGRDGQGRKVSSGQYLARLQVRGPGVRQNMTRSVTVVR